MEITGQAQWSKLSTYLASIVENLGTSLSTAFNQRFYLSLNRETRPSIFSVRIYTASIQTLTKIHQQLVPSHDPKVRFYQMTQGRTDSDWAPVQSSALWLMSGPCRYLKGYRPQTRVCSWASRASSPEWALLSNIGYGTKLDPFCCKWLFGFGRSQRVSVSCCPYKYTQQIWGFKMCALFQQGTLGFYKAYW